MRVANSNQLNIFAYCQTTSLLIFLFSDYTNYKIQVYAPTSKSSKKSKEFFRHYLKCCEKWGKLLNFDSQIQFKSNNLRA